MDVFVVFAAVITCAYAQQTTTVLNTTNVAVQLQEISNGINLILYRNNSTEVIAVLGRDAGAISSLTNTNGRVTVRMANNATLLVTSEQVTGNRSGVLVSVAWEAVKTTVLEDCISLSTHHWYGGPQQKHQYWPIEGLTLSKYSYITKEADNCGVAEPYWLSSSGIFYYINKTVPLFIDQNNKYQKAACFIAEITPPYSSKRERNNLNYVIGVFENPRVAHEFVVDRYFGKPTGYPDERMIKYPVWSTWARYKTDVNSAVVLKFADEIISYGFPNSQLEIDDLWEVCYGSQTVDVKRFPSMKGTIDTLKSKGFRVTMWTHPFLNKGCEPWYTEAKTNGYVVSAENSSIESSWWNDNGTTTSYIDFTKQSARDWYMTRLHTLQNETGVDSFKFDGGESSWSPQIPVLQGNVMEQPNIITTDYVNTVASFGSLMEVRVGYHTQNLPIFVRMIDKDTYWDFKNGLATLITTLLQMNMNGYPLVLPDMVGGNGYNVAPDKQLFLRWLQANVFMPSVQFSYVPWDFDNETIAISKKFVELHAQYAPNITAACQRAVADGSPVNPPIWWIAPNDADALAIWDQYLLGENILVAPILSPNTTSRYIYLPSGTWYEQGDRNKTIQGPIWLRNYPAPIDVLPYFIRGEDGQKLPDPEVPGSGSKCFGSLMLVVLTLMLNI